MFTSQSLTPDVSSTGVDAIIAETLATADQATALSDSGVAAVGAAADSEWVMPAVAPTPSWRKAYQRVVLVIDFVAALVGVFIGLVERFGIDRVFSATNEMLLAGLIPIAWICCAGLNRAYESQFLGAGSTEFDRVGRAFLHLVALTTFIAYVSKVDLSRGFVLVALPMIVVLSLAGRFAARKLLHRRRRQGKSMTAVVAVGGVASIASFTSLLRRDLYAGMEVVGACVPAGVEHDAEAHRELEELGITIVSDLDSIRDVVGHRGAHTVAVLSGEVSAEKLRWISWQLEGTQTDLVVSPGLAEIGGRRLHVQPAAGLPLLHIQEPKFGGFHRMIKSVFDRTVAAVSLLLLAPLLLGVGLVVRLTSRGPALFMQTRVGRDGHEFRMVKFRSMVVDAEQRRVELLDSNENDGLLFKMRADPRVTRVGRVLRRFSLDELPQLLNVLFGSMSLVGPRPPLPAEVALYQDEVRRRLLVKPGLTGLWQVSGRSDLSWEESVRLDLRYVEDWSLSLDMVVLWKTARAVMKSEGAY